MSEPCPSLFSESLALLLETTGARLERDYAVLTEHLTIPPEALAILEAHRSLGTSIKKMVARSRSLGLVYDDRFHSGMRAEFARLEGRS